MYYTSYFGNIKKLDKSKYGQLASITAKKPNFAGHEILDWSFIGPDSDTVARYKAGEISEDEYSKQYIDKLTRLWPGVAMYIQINYYKNIVLLCYEKKGKFCHRHILSQFLRDHGIECEEI